MKLAAPVAAGIALLTTGCPKVDDNDPTSPGIEVAVEEGRRWHRLDGQMDIVRQLRALQDGAEAKQQPVLLSFSAAWCVPCKEMEANVFTDVRVKRALKNFLAIKIDTTHETDGVREIQRRYSITSLPTLLFFDSAGRHVEDIRVHEKVDAPTLVELLAQVQQEPRKTAPVP